MLQDSLRKFRALPPTERTPGAVQVPPLPFSARDQRYTRALPKDIIPVKVHARVLTENGQGEYAACGQPGTNTETYRHSGFGVATDHLWIKKVELGAVEQGSPGKSPDRKCPIYSPCVLPASTSWTIPVVNHPTGAGTKSANSNAGPAR